MIAVLSPLKSVSSAEYGTAALRTTYAANGTEATPLPWTVDGTAIFTDTIRAYATSQSSVAAEIEFVDYTKTTDIHDMAQVVVSVANDASPVGAVSRDVPFRVGADWTLRLASGEAGTYSQGVSLKDVLKFTASRDGYWDATTPRVTSWTFDYVKAYRLEQTDRYFKIGTTGMTWPAAHAAGVLTNNGSGTLAWASTVALGGTAQDTWADSTATPSLQVLGTDVSGSTIGVARFVANAGNPKLFFGKSRGATIGSYTIVQASDTLGSLEFFGSDGSDFSRAAMIAVTVDGTPGANVMPGRIAFYTHNSSGVLTQALDIRADQTATFAKSVSINGATYAWPTANAAGVLTNNGSGTLTWAASGGGGITDAPNDGKLYVRKSLAWADLSAETPTVARLTVGSNGSNAYADCLVHGSYAEAQVANSRVHGLGTYTVLGSEFRPQYTELTAQGQTTSATPLAIYLNLPYTISGGLGNIGGTFQVQVFGFNHTDSDQVGGYMITGAFRGAGGNFIITGTNTTTAYETNTAWACTVTDSGSGLGLQVNVTGAASKTINWVAYARILHVRQVS